MVWIVDADVTKCFDTIPQDKLLRTVARRVVDGSMLALVKKFLEAPVIEEREGGRRSRPRRGTPQGGPASPLLANIYLELLDRNFRRHVERGELQGRLVRYCDDLVIVCPHRADVEMAWLARLLARMGLTLHPDKTRITHVGDEWVDFLGDRVRRRSNGRVVLDISKKARSRIRDTLRASTRRTLVSLDELIAELNVYIRGAREYFCLAKPDPSPKLP